MFNSLECAQKACVPLPAVCRGGVVHADDYGGLWIVSGDAQEVVYCTAPEALAATAPEHGHSEAHLLPGGGAASSPSEATAAAATAPHRTAYRCGPSASGAAAASDEEGGSDDGVHSVLFFSRDACAGDSRRRDVCVVTRRGTLAFISVPQRSAPPPTVQPYQVASLGIDVCATTATVGASQCVVLCCHDGAFTEVIRVTVAAVDGPGADGVPAPAAAVGCEVDASGLFRIEGRIAAVLHDPVAHLLLTVSDGGYVDVWDVAAARDVTAAYGALSWDPHRSGSPTCALLCRDRLWVGLTSGKLLIFDMVHGGGAGGDDDAAATARPRDALLVRSHTSPITGLMAMSLGTSVWSCAAESAKVSVWDAASATLRGAFVFSEAGTAAWRVGAVQLHTSLWGVDAATGESSLLQVSQSLQDVSAALLQTRDEVQAQHRREAASRASRVCWQSTKHSLQALLFIDGVGSTGTAADATMSAAQQLAAREEGISEDDIDVLVGIHAICDGARRLCAAYQREHLDCCCRGGSAADLPLLIGECVAWHERQRRVSHEAEALLSGLRATDAEAAGMLTLEDVGEEVRHLRTRVDELQRELHHLKDIHGDGDAAGAGGGDEAAAAVMAVALQDARDALHAEQERCGSLQAQLREALAELESLTSQHAQAQQLLAAAEEDSAQLRRSLLAAKRAAEVSARDVSSVFEMESQLHKSHGVIAELSRKVDALLNEADATRESLLAFEARQTAAKEVVRRVLRTQHSIADDVGALVDHVRAATRAHTERHGASLDADVAALLSTVESAAYELEDSVEGRLRDQKAWLHTLSRELAASIT
ncbi:wd40 repeat domain-containing protein [Novymonas esmeraldas]|uniref:Wd40 repeat domain-containing protein n=1 Tax=Novymonas esmeraldas TaxID=1808958 RepID=A0AAW0FE73_9TRYP